MRRGWQCLHYGGHVESSLDDVAVAIIGIALLSRHRQDLNFMA